MTTATLIILRDPAGILGREVLRLHGDATLQLQIEAAMPGGGAECDLLINGERADPMTDARLDAPPRAGDTIVVAHRPAGPVPTWVLVVSGLLAVAAYALIPKVPDAPVATDSPNNRLTGQTNVARAYQAIPDVYGRRRVWPDLIQRTLVEYVDHVRTLTEWLCISRGVGDVTDVRFSDTPILDIDGASFEVFAPTTVGTVPPGVPSTYAEAKWAALADVYEPFPSASVDGQEIGLTVSDSVVEQGATLGSSGSTTFTLTFTDGAQFDAIEALVPSGTTSVQFSYLVGSDPPSVGIFSETCTVLASSASGGSITFTLQGTSTVPAEASGQVVTARLSLGTTSNYSDWFYLPVEADRIWWNMVFLRGLQGTVQVLVEWEAVDDNNETISGSEEDDTFDYTAATNDQRFFTTKVTPAYGEARYRVRFRRTTADLGNGADTAKLEALFAVRYYATKLLPGVTAIRLTTRATEQATSARELKFNLTWQRHVRTLDSDTVSASRNFARAMAHLWTISGQAVADLDTATLAAVNTALGETDALLRFDGSLDDADMALLERMQLIANTARCLFWRDGAKWTVTRDQAREAPELQLDYRNLAARGDSVVNESFHLPASSDGVEVEYVDEVTGTKKAYYRLNISSGSPVAGECATPLRVKLPGCTTDAQAINRAQLEARKLLYQRTSVTDTALGDAQQLGPGSLVRWIDPNDFAGDDGLQAGEVLAIAGSIITTSEPLNFGAEASGRIQFTGDDGMLLGAPVECTPVSGQAYQATLASVPGGLYVADGETSQLGSRYAFAVGLTDAEVEAAGLYTVTEPRPNGDGTWSLAMVNYDARIYAYDSAGRTTIAAGVGAAVASGLRATIDAGYVIVEAGVGEAVASGLSASITVAVPTTIAAGVGAAVASGLSASIVESGPIDGASFLDGAVNGLGGTAIAGVRFKVAGAVAQAQTAAASSYADYSTWHRGTVSLSWWVRFTTVSVSGGTLGGVGGGWQPMTADRTVTLTAAPLDEASALVTVEFAADLAGADIRATQSVSLSALSVS